MVALCRVDRDVTFLPRATGAAIMVGIGLAFAIGNVTATGAERFAQGLLGPIILGLVSAFLVLLGVTQPLYRRRRTRLLLILSGVAGSCPPTPSSSLALIKGLALLWGLRNREMGTGRALVGVHGITSRRLPVRSYSPPFEPVVERELRINSAEQRLIDPYAGVNVFLQHPLAAVGWAGNSRAVGSPAVASTVRQMFVSANPLLYLDIQGAGVHDAYIQLLAELELIGGLLLLWLARNCFQACRALVRAGRPLAPFLGGSLILFAVWWNETGLFGGQPETFLFGVALGSVAVACSEVREEFPAFEASRYCLSSSGPSDWRRPLGK